MKPAFAPKYRKPTGPYLNRCEATEELYRVERIRDESIDSAAKQIQEICGFTHFWQEAVPEALLSVLEAWDQKAAQLAAVAYLEKQNRRAYTKIHEQFLVVRNVNLDVLKEEVNVLNELQLTNQWENLNQAQRDAVIGICAVLANEIESA